MTSTLDTERARDRRLAAIRTALPLHLERLTWDQQRIATHQRDMLRILLRHALGHSPFHGARLAGVDPDRFELGDLSTLPTMTKREMMASYESVVTDPRLTREVVEEHLVGTGSDASELFGEYVVLASGGSSGERGVFAYSREAAPNLMLGLARPGMKRLLASGEPPPGGWSMAMVAAASAMHASRAVASLFGASRSR